MVYRLVGIKVFWEKVKLLWYKTKKSSAMLLQLYHDMHLNKRKQKLKTREGRDI
jgi:hypothetical protein